MLKKSVIKLHISSQKHKWGKEWLASNLAREKSICESLKGYNAAMHAVGENLWNIVQCVCSLKLLAKSVSGEEVAQ